MRTLLLVLCLFSLTTRAGAWSKWSHKYDEDKPIAGERDYILRIFDFYIPLKQNFEREHYSSGSRDLIEDYTTAFLLPACGNCVKLLRTGRDTELMLAYLRLLQSTASSGSEGFGGHLAEIFIVNPEVVTGAYPRLSIAQKRVVFEELSWGVKNYPFTAKQARLREHLTRILSQMNPKAK